jgi:hypothetical protein
MRVLHSNAKSKIKNAAAYQTASKNARRRLQDFCSPSQAYFCAILNLKILIRVANGEESMGGVNV